MSPKQQVFETTKRDQISISIGHCFARAKYIQERACLRIFTSFVHYQDKQRCKNRSFSLTKLTISWPNLRKTKHILDKQDGKDKHFILWLYRFYLPVASHCMFFGHSCVRPFRWQPLEKKTILNHRKKPGLAK